MSNVLNKIIDMICKKDGVSPEDVHFSGDSNRFWIDVLNSKFSGDLDTDDPILKQYHLVETTNDNIDDPLRLKLKESNIKQNTDIVTPITWTELF